MSVDIDNTVVGYVGYTFKGVLLRNHQACLVTRSAASLRERPGGKNAQIIKVRFGEIVTIIERTRDYYAFDRPAYRRFYALVQKARKSWDLPHPDTVRLELVHVGGGVRNKRRSGS